MPVTVTQKTKPSKQKEATVIDTENVYAPMSKKIDRLGELQKKLLAAAKRVAPLQAEFQKIEAELLALVDTDKKPGESVVVAGDVTAVEVSAKGNKTTITNKAEMFNMFEKIETGLAKKLLSFAIGDMNTYLTPTQIKKVAKTEQVNKRRLKFVAKP